MTKEPKGWNLSMQKEANRRFNEYPGSDYDQWMWLENRITDENIKKELYPEFPKLKPRNFTPEQIKEDNRKEEFRKPEIWQNPLLDLRKKIRG